MKMGINMSGESGVKGGSCRWRVGVGGSWVTESRNKVHYNDISKTKTRRSR